MSVDVRARVCTRDACVWLGRLLGVFACCVNAQCSANGGDLCFDVCFQLFEKGPRSPDEILSFGICCCLCFICEKNKLPHPVGWQTLLAKFNYPAAWCRRYSIRTIMRRTIGESHTHPAAKLHTHTHTHNHVATHYCPLCVEPRTCELAPVQALYDSEGLRNAFCVSNQ